MNDFTFKMPTKIIFGIGKSRKLSEVCSMFSANKVFLVTDRHISCTPSFKELIKGLEYDGIPYVLYEDAVPEPPVESIDSASQVLKESGCDLVVAVGGGSPIDTGKAISMLQTNKGSIREYLFGGSRTVTNRPLPLVAVPTTARSGSEVTGASVISDTQNKIKLSVTHDFLIPSAAVIDPLMHTGMPGIITTSTGMDALTHAIEAFVSLNANPVSDAFAMQAIRLIAANLRTAFSNPKNLEARSNMATASTIAAAAFVNAGLGAVHGISQSMGGVAHVSHGISNSLMLPYVCAKNLVGNLEKFAVIAELLGEATNGLSLRDKAETAVHAIRRLSVDLKIPQRLSEVNVTKEMFPDIVKGTMEYRMLALNPVVLTEQDVYDILEKSF